MTRAREYAVTVNLRVTDPAAAHDSAVTVWMMADPTVSAVDIESMLGTRRQPDISACLQMLIDPGGLPWINGIQVEETTVD